MGKFTAWKTDVPLGLDRTTFLECFSPSVRQYDKELDVEYWTIQVRGKDVYVYDWEGELFLNDTETDQETEILSKAKTCVNGFEEMTTKHNKQEPSKDEDINKLLYEMTLNDDGISDTGKTPENELIKAYYPPSKLETLIENIENMDYASNTFKDKNHERNVETILKSLGFSEIEEHPSSIGDFYIREPNGGQNPPDFRVYSNNEQLDIECKSCRKGYKPMWNASYPQGDMVYVYTNSTDNTSVVFSGEEVVTPEVQAIYEEYKRLNKELHAKINERLNSLPAHQNPYGMQVYARNMFVQTKHLDVNNRKMYKEQALKKIKETKKRT
jgi:hypothetical protein